MTTGEEGARSVGQRARRVGTELAVIVSGVLIALWADGMVAERSTRRELDEHLETVRAELVQVASELDRHVAVLETRLESLDWLASFAANDASGDDRAVYEAVAQGLLDPRTFEPELGALTDLESAGLMPAVRTVELRTTLSGLRDALRFLATSETVNITGPAQRVFDPWVLEELPFVWSEMARYDGRAGGPAEPLEAADWSPLRTVRGQAILAMQYDLVASTLREWQAFEEHLEATVRLIDEELAID